MPETQVKQAKIVAEIKRIHTLPKHDNYGSPRVHQELNRAGVSCCENTVAKLMRLEGIRSKVARKFKVATTDSNHDLPVAPNRLNQDFQVQKLDQVWLTDFTYIQHKEGLSYLCTIQDLCSRKIAGWAVGNNIDAALAVKALDQAITLRQPKRGLIVHSDRGSQFASLLFQNRLSKHGCLSSMSRKGNCYDNAPMESFFKTFKTEEVYQSDYQSHEDVVRSTVDYIERFYNATRLHSALGYLSPIEFEQSLRSKARRKSSKPLAD
jgi:putative transposase